jgi:hypothetical protein
MATAHRVTADHSPEQRSLNELHSRCVVGVKEVPGSLRSATETVLKNIRLALALNSAPQS